MTINGVVIEKGAVLHLHCKLKLLEKYYQNH